MRILVLSNLFPPAVYGGYEIECATVVAHLREEHEVLVLTSREGRRRGVAEPGVSRVLPFLPYRKLTQLLSPVNTIRAAVSTRRALRAFAPEVVYVWNGSMIPQVAIRLLETSGADVVFRICEHWFGTLYDSDEFMGGLRGRRWKRVMGVVNRLPALRIEARQPVAAAISWNSETLRRLTPMPDTVRPLLERAILPATAQGETFVRVKRRPSAEPTILFVGRVAAYKGADVAVRALAELRERHRLRARLIVAGAGEPEFLRELEQLAGEIGVGDLLELRGPLGTAALQSLFGSAHALLAPSVWEEPAGLVVVEAALARVPVVASRVGGIPEFLEDGEHALLFPPGDPVAAAQALADTLSGGAKTEARVERAFVHVQQFRLDRYLSSMDQFFTDALGALRT